MNHIVHPGISRQLEVAPPPQNESRAASVAASIAEAITPSHLVALLNVLRRRWLVILAAMVFITASTFALLLYISPRYTAEAMVMLDTRKAQVGLAPQPLIPGLQADGVVAVVLKTETEVLRSPALAEKVIDKLGLLNNPEFNPTLVTPWRQRLSAWLRERLLTSLPAPLSNHLLAWWPLAPAVPAEAKQEQAMAGAVDTLLNRLTIANDGRSYILRIRVETKDPKLSAEIANTYAELYLLAQLDAKYQETSRVNGWLNDRLSELREKVRDSDNAVQQYMVQHQITPLTEDKGTTVNGQQLSEINTQLILATSDRTQKEATLRQVEDAIRMGKGSEAATQVLASPVIQHLSEQEADLLRKQAEMEAHYLPQYPALIRLKAELKDLRSKIAVEVQKIVSAMRNDVTVARMRESTLRAKLAELRHSAARQDEAEVGLRELRRQADANKTLYEAFLQKFKLTNSEQQIEQPDAHIVSSATVPTRASWPPKTFFLGLALLVSALIGAILAFCIEQLESCFRDSQDLERASGLRNLALVPAIGAKGQLARMIMSEPMSPYTESVRSVWTALRHYRGGRPIKTILVTSSVPGEGKSSFAVSLAQAAARSGARTLLIDCDLRRPTIHRALNIAEGSLARHGVLGLMDGRATPDSVILEHKESGVDLVLSGGTTDNPQAILQSTSMDRYLAEMREHYDCIVIDSPPVLLASDASILSNIADATMFVVRWEETPRNVVMNGLNTLRVNGGFIAGTVLAQVNLRKHAKYRFGDLGYYYKSYRSYGLRAPAE